MKTRQLQTNKQYSTWSYIIAFLLLILPFWGLHYTSDWDAYNYYFSHPTASRDYFFSVLANFFSDKGYGFETLYRFNILLIGFSYLWLFRKTRTNLILLAIITVLFNYVAIGNQIRFFLAFPCCILSVYFFIRKNYWVCIALLIFSILNHKTSIILFIILISTSIIVYRAKVFKQFIYIIIANFVIFFLLNYTISFDEKYADYISQNYISSLAGGLFNIFPYLFPIFFSFKLNQMTRKYNKNLIDNKLYKFLYSGAIASSVFLISGLEVQVLANRFITSFLPIWISFFLFIGNNATQTIRSKARKYIVYTIVIMLTWTFLIKPFLGFKEYLNEAELMFSSYSF